MLKVTVDNDPQSIRIREGEKNGRKWRMVTQKVWIHKPRSPFPERFEISMPSGLDGYPPGEYVLDLEAMLEPGSYQALHLNDRDGVLLVAAHLVDKTQIDTLHKSNSGDKKSGFNLQS
ncbi:hypothetical protein [Methylomonas sp. AM2-LC]|uniref:single-stranded DNA-binding protein n=1 Tax=Methylomonas sp. AM2-LC TaxID=3153301 RepID=UPI0032637A91